MPKIARTLTTEAPVEHAFAYLADFSNSEEWDPGTDSAVARTNDGPHVGQTYDLVVRWGDRELPMVYEITDLKPNRRVTLVGDGSTTHAVDTIEFEELPGGDTQITYTADIRLKGFLRFAEPFLRGKFEQLLDHGKAGMSAALDRLATTDGN